MAAPQAQAGRLFDTSEVCTVLTRALTKIVHPFIPQAFVPSRWTEPISFVRDISWMVPTPTVDERLSTIVVDLPD